MKNWLSFDAKEKFSHGKLSRERMERITEWKKSFFFPPKFYFFVGNGAAGHFLSMFVYLWKSRIFSGKTFSRIFPLFWCWWLFGIFSLRPFPHRIFLNFHRIFPWFFDEKVEFSFHQHQTSKSFHKNYTEVVESGWFLHHLVVYGVLAKNLFAFNSTSSSTFPAAAKKKHTAVKKRSEREK